MTWFIEGDTVAIGYWKRYEAAQLYTPMDALLQNGKSFKLPDDLIHLSVFTLNIQVKNNKRKNKLTLTLKKKTYLEKEFKRFDWFSYGELYT